MQNRFPALMFLWPGMRPRCRTALIHDGSQPRQKTGVGTPNGAPLH